MLCAARFHGVFSPQRFDLATWVAYKERMQQGLASVKPVVRTPPKNNIV